MQDDELREKLDIRSRLGGLSIFKLGFGFDTYELVEFILADRKKHELQARIDELANVGGVNDSYSSIGHLKTGSVKDRIAKLKQELQKL